MAFTDNCDIYASIHEDGLNAILGHVRRQRPSLFNYATAELADAALSKRRGGLCRDITAHPIVDLRDNPKVTIVEPLPIPGTHYGVNFAVQLSDLRLDFHPGNQFALPPELDPLKDQRLAIMLEVCGGIACPPREIVDKLVILAGRRSKERQHGERPAPTPIVALPARDLNCFCLQAFVTGGMRIASYGGKPYLEPFLDSFEIVDIKPVGLENSLECYISLMLRLVVLPGLRVLLERLPLNLTQGATDFFPQPTNVVIGPMPTSAALPNNPAIQDDQLQAFIKVEVI